MKRFLFVLINILFIITSVDAKEKFTVVIDPGHGGKDGGAARGNIKEKNINLGVALKLGQFIENKYKDVKVVYTRKNDTFIPLDKRADIANKANANLFISIHTNSTAAKITTASGADTYILGVDQSEENMRVAQRENSVIELEDNYKQKYQDFDPNSPESYIIFEFMTNKYMEQSLDFAGKSQKHFKKTAKRNDRGVKQAGFLVLRATACPSVLIELGFINNPTEAKFLASDVGQRTMASAILAGLDEYKRDFDNKQGSATDASSQDDTNYADSKQTNQKTSGTTFVSKPATSPVAKSNTDSKTPTKEDKKPVQSQQSAQSASVEKPKEASAPTQATEKVPSGVIEYRIQLSTSPRKIATTAANFNGLSPIGVYLDGTTYKYTYGSTTDSKQASKMLREAKVKYKDAFIIRLKNGKRIQ